MAEFFGKFFRRSNVNKVVRPLPKNSYDRKVISEDKKKKPVKGRKAGGLRFFVWFLATTLLGVVVYMLFFSPFLSIDEISIKGEENLKSEDILASVRTSMEGRYFNALEKNNFILLNRDEIRNDLFGRFKRIEDIDISREFPNKIEIKIKERKSMMIFCAEEPCWIIDENGRAYAEADFSSNELGEQDLIILRNINHKNISKEDIFIENDLMRFAIEIREKLRSESGIEIEKEYFTPALVSGDLRVKTSEGWKIYFNKNLGSKKTFEMLKVILEGNIDAAKRADLDYIDLRVNNKAYYKFKKVENASDENKEDGSHEVK